MEYVFPAMSAKSPEHILHRIKEAGHSIGSAVTPLFEFYCGNGKIDDALYLIENYEVSIHPNFDFGKFLHLWDEKFRNSANYLQVLHYLLIHYGSSGHDEEVVTGKNLSMVAQRNPSLFEVLIGSKKSNFSNRCIDVCREILKMKKPVLLEHLKGLNSRRSYDRNKVPETIAEEEEHVNLLRKRNLPIHQYVLDLLNHHMREKNVGRVLELRAKLDDEGFEIGALALSKLLGFYSEMGDLQSAQHIFKDLGEKHPTFKIDAMMVLDYATLLFKCSRFEEAETIIRNHLFHIFGNKEFILRSLRKCVNVAVETGDSDLVRNLQETLVCHAKEFDSKEIFFEPTLRLHLFRNDLDAAVEEFKACVTNHKVAPCLNMLLKKFITIDDHMNLENIIESAASLLGKNNVLHELVFAFVETGRKPQALKVLQNLGAKVSPSYIENLANRLYNQNRAFELEDLFWLSTEIPCINKDNLCYYLFKIYDAKNDFKRAENLCRSIEREQLCELSGQTKKLLANLFSRNNVREPVSLLLQEEQATLNGTNGPLQGNNESVTEFLDFVQKESAVEALEKLESYKKGFIRAISPDNFTKFIDLLLKKECLFGLTKNVQAMSYLIENVSEIVTPLLEKYSKSSDVESLMALGGILPDFALQKCTFRTYLTKAYINGGKHEELLHLLEKHRHSNSKLFSVVAFSELLNLEHLQKRAIDLAIQYEQSEFNLPISVVWAHFLINENYEKADEFLKTYSVSVDKVYTTVLKAVRDTENVSIGMKYISAINQLKVRPRYKERAYGTVLDILVSRGEFDSAANLVKEAKLADVDLQKHFKSTMLKLKSELERERKDVSFSISSQESVV